MVHSYYCLSSICKDVVHKLIHVSMSINSLYALGGLNNGVTCHVGDALVTERSPRLRSGRVVSIGIAPWGVVENRRDLVQKNKAGFVSFYGMTLFNLIFYC